MMKSQFYRSKRIADGAIRTVLISISCILTLTMICAEDLVGLDARYQERIAKVEAEYLDDLGAALKDADLIKLHVMKYDDTRPMNPGLQLDFNQEAEFPDFPNECYRKILGSIDVRDSAQMISIVQPVQECLTIKRNVGRGKSCHEPFYGICIFKSDKLLFRGTLCLTCCNLGVRTPIGGEILPIGETEIAKLAKLLHAMFPIPKDEIEKLYKKHPTLRLKSP